MKVKENGKSFDPVPAGFYQAVCYSIVDLGSVMNTKFQNWQRKVLITFEIPSVRIEIERDGQKMDMPRVISKQYTANLSPKGYLRKDLESWRGRPFTDEELQGFELSKLLGANCQIQVMHNKSNGNVYANISAIVNVGKDQKRLIAENPLVHYCIDENREEIPSEIPEWLANKIKESPEYKSLSTPDGPGEEDDGHLPPIEDDIPF